MTTLNPAAAALAEARAKADAARRRLDDAKAAELQLRDLRASLVAADKANADAQAELERATLESVKAQIERENADLAQQAADAATREAEAAAAIERKKALVTDTLAKLDTLATTAEASDAAILAFAQHVTALRDLKRKIDETLRKEFNIFDGYHPSNSIELRDAGNLVELMGRSSGPAPVAFRTARDEVATFVRRARHYLPTPA